MLKIMTSASRVVLILMTLAAIVGFILGKLEAKEFMILAGMVFAFYFTKTDGGRNDDYTT